MRGAGCIDRRHQDRITTHLKIVDVLTCLATDVNAGQSSCRHSAAAPPLPPPPPPPPAGHAQQGALGRRSRLHRSFPAARSWLHARSLRPAHEVRHRRHGGRIACGRWLRSAVTRSAVHRTGDGERRCSPTASGLAECGACGPGAALQLQQAPAIGSGNAATLGELGPAGAAGQPKPAALQPGLGSHGAHHAQPDRRCSRTGDSYPHASCRRRCLLPPTLLPLPAAAGFLRSSSRSSHAAQEEGGGEGEAHPGPLPHQPEGAARAVGSCLLPRVLGWLQALARHAGAAWQRASLGAAALCAVRCCMRPDRQCVWLCSCGRWVAAMLLPWR